MWKQQHERRCGRYENPEAASWTDRTDALAPNSAPILQKGQIEDEEVVQDLVDRLAAVHSLTFDVAFEQGGDTATQQDVAFLVRAPSTFTAERFTFTHHGDPDHKELTKHLRLETSIDSEPFTFVTVHLLASSLSGRLRQAVTLRDWIETQVTTDNLIILGDFNTRQNFNQTTPTSEMGIIRGFTTPSLTDDLYDAHEILGDRATHTNGDELDRILLTEALRDDTGWRLNAMATRGDLVIRGTEDGGSGVDYSLPDNEQDLSDHFPVVATFTRLEPVTRGDLLARLAAIEQTIQQLLAEMVEVRTLVGSLDH